MSALEAVAVYRYLSRGRREYPPLLAAIPDPPSGLYVRGDASVSMLAAPSVAVVGSRSCSSYGAAVARKLGRALAEAGIVVVSGLARGIDGEAHRGALEAGGPTVAVLGCGIDREYPVANGPLSRQIERYGLIVSEYEPGVQPAPWRFPARNRIIAGLCRATVIVEARERSGALITADFALDDGREVFAVPGEITSALSRGANQLIRQGATPLLEAGQVIEALGIAAPGHAVLPRLSERARMVLCALGRAGGSIDELALQTSMGAEHVAAALVELELAGVAAQGNGVYRAL